MTRAIIRNAAFITLITSCMEVYKKESFGIILGHKTKSDYILKTCIPFQSAKRGYMSAYLSTKRERRINEALSCMSNDILVADFHSHPGELIDYLSEADKVDLYKRQTDYVSILVSLKKANRYKKWEYNTDLSISGSVGRFFVKIKAFHYTYETGDIKQICINCPYLETLNMIYCDMNRFRPEYKRKKKEKKK